MRKYLFILTVLFIVSFNSFAQKRELGKVTIEELKEKVHPKDSSASAAILFEKGKAYFEYTQEEGFRLITEVEVRIKIYKKDGYDWANKQVVFYIGDAEKEMVEFSKAITYNLVNGAIEKTKLKSEGEFTEKVNKYWAKKKIAMPNVKEGSVIEYKYLVRSPRIGSLKEWNFQTSIPVNYSEYKTNIPEYFVYNTNQKGYIFPKVTVEKINGTMTYNYREPSVPGGTIVHSVSEEKLEFNELQTIYLAENLPAMKDEAYVNNIDNYTSGISHELSMLRYPNTSFKPYSTDWETVTKTIYEYEDFGGELNKSGYFEDDITTLITGLKSQNEIIPVIFNYVKSRVKWNNYYGYSCNDGVKKAYKDKTGNVAEINLMLTAMLRYAGINANPVLVSTRSNGITFFPSRNAFNYLIAAVEIQNELILLDATEKFSSPNILPLRDLNWYGRLIRKDGSSTNVNLIPKSLSKEITFMNIILNSDGLINGKIRNQFTDHKALSFRQKNIGISQDNYLEELENENDDIEISEYVRDNDLDLSKPIIETYSFKDTKGMEKIGDKIYIYPLLFLTTTGNPFKQEIREYPVDFGYPIQSKYTINIEVPKGYIIESLPKGINLVTGDEIGAFKYIIGNTGNKIQITITTDINSAIVAADSYDVLKDFYQKMIDKQTEKIILKKA